MSQKKEKRIRRHARWLYEIRLQTWENDKPPFWRFIARRKWKKAKPEYETAEKFFRENYK